MQTLDFKPCARVNGKALGISAKRSLPHYARERFDKWFAKRWSVLARCVTRLA